MMSKVIYIGERDVSGRFGYEGYGKVVAFLRDLKIDTLIVSSETLGVEELSEMFVEAEVVHDKEMSEVGMNHFWVHDIASKLCGVLDGMAYDLDFGIGEVVFSAAGKVVASLLVVDGPNFVVLDDVDDLVVFEKFEEVAVAGSVFEQEAAEIEVLMEGDSWIGIA